MGTFGQEKGKPAPNAGKKYAPEPLTPDEVHAIISQCSTRAPTGIRNRAMLTLLYRSGLRVNEMLALRPSDVDFTTHSIRLLDTKSGKAQTRGFHPSVDDALARWIDTRKAHGIGAGCKLFTTLDGGPVSEHYVRALLHRLADQEHAGIEKRVHPHGLRHTFAVELEQAGMPVTEISKLLGHSSIAITARYLDHLTNARAVTALAAVEMPSLGEPLPVRRRVRSADTHTAEPEANAQPSTPLPEVARDVPSHPVAKADTARASSAPSTPRKPRRTFSKAALQQRGVARSPRLADVQEGQRIAFTTENKSGE